MTHKGGHLLGTPGALMSQLNSMERKLYKQIEFGDDDQRKLVKATMEGSRKFIANCLAMRNGKLVKKPRMLTAEQMNDTPPAKNAG